MLDLLACMLNCGSGFAASWVSVGFLGRCLLLFRIGVRWFVDCCWWYCVLCFLVCVIVCLCSGWLGCCSLRFVDSFGSLRFVWVWL